MAKTYRATKRDELVAVLWPTLTQDELMMLAAAGAKQLVFDALIDCNNSAETQRWIDAGLFRGKK